MVKNGAPPDKFLVLHSLSPIKSHGFTSRIEFLGLSLFCYWYYLTFLEKIWTLLNFCHSSKYFTRFDTYPCIGLPLISSNKQKNLYFPSFYRQQEVYRGLHLREGFYVSFPNLQSPKASSSGIYPQDCVKI